MEQWQREDFPAIQRQAKKENTMIFFADDAGRALGLPQRAHVGDSGPDPGGSVHRRTVFSADVVGDQRPE